jgi:quercetin dioxygenase-like cupin family protein
MSGRARPTVQIDNERVRVTEWQFTPGAATGWHRHEYDYVVVPMTTGPLRARTAQGEMVSELVTGWAYFREAGVEHDVSNPNAYEFIFVETEVKAR